MKLSEHKDLKREILNLPEKEKDKLLLRLVAKDKVLTEHLHFLLLEDESNLRDRVAFLKNEINESFKDLANSPKTTAKETLLVIRKLTKEINHFYKVTKADVDELELKLLMFSTAPMLFKYRVYSATKNYEQLFAHYMVKSVLVVLRKFAKLHEDLQFDLSEKVNTMLGLIYASYLADTANEFKLPKSIN